jgi:hypothetical protein
MTIMSAASMLPIDRRRRQKRAKERAARVCCYPTLQVPTVAPQLR